MFYTNHTSNRIHSKKKKLIIIVDSNNYNYSNYNSIVLFNIARTSIFWNWIVKDCDEYRAVF
jgi:hypothetical protein